MSWGLKGLKLSNSRSQCVQELRGARAKRFLGLMLPANANGRGRQRASPPYLKLTPTSRATSEKRRGEISRAPSLPFQTCLYQTKYTPIRSRKSFSCNGGALRTSSPRGGKYPLLLLRSPRKGCSNKNTKTSNVHRTDRDELDPSELKNTLGIK